MSWPLPIMATNAKCYYIEQFPSSGVPEPIRNFRGTPRPAIVCAVSEFIGKDRFTCHRGVL